MYYGYAKKNWETTQQTYLYSQTVRVKKPLSKQRFFSFNVASGTLDEELLYLVLLARYIFHTCFVVQHSMLCIV